MTRPVRPDVVPTVQTFVTSCPRCTGFLFLVEQKLPDRPPVASWQCSGDCKPEPVRRRSLLARVLRRAR